MTSFVWFVEHFPTQSDVSSELLKRFLRFNRHLHGCGSRGTGRGRLLGCTVTANGMGMKRFTISHKSELAYCFMVFFFFGASLLLFASRSGVHFSLRLNGKHPPPRMPDPRPAERNRV